MDCIVDALVGRGQASNLVVMKIGRHGFTSREGSDLYGMYGQEEINEFGEEYRPSWHVRKTSASRIGQRHALKSPKAIALQKLGLKNWTKMKLSL